MGNDHASSLLWKQSSDPVGLSMFDMTDAGRWEQVHLRHATARDIASADDVAVEDGPWTATRSRLYQTCHRESGDRASDGLIFTRLVSQEPWFKF